MAEKKKTIDMQKTLGETLKEARTAQGLTLENVAEKLCIGKKHLKNLEDNSSDLSCDVYTLGFLRLYSDYLGLNPKLLCEQFKQNCQTPSEPVAPPLPTPGPGKGLPPLPIIGFSAFALATLFIGFKWLSSSPSTDPLPAPKQLTTTVAPPPPPKKTILMAKTEPIVLMKVSEESWVEVKNQKGETVVVRTFKPNDNYEFKNPRSLTLNTGNAKGIQLISEEKVLSFPKNADPVQSNIPLNSEKWVDIKPVTL